MDRREFLKSMGAGALATAALAAGCDSPNQTTAEGFSTGEVPTDKMTYRTGTHGEKVSLLGYGCMRLPSTEEGKDGLSASACSVAASTAGRKSDRRPRQVSV